VYVATFDGYLIAINAQTGKQVWKTDTIARTAPYTITGAPRVFKGKVIIGNGGAEYGVRGYVSAYDAETGEQLWRTYTVPGDPADGFESEAMERAAETWTGEWWKFGGGGTAWDSFAYDPDLDLMYVGVSATGLPGIVRFGVLVVETIYFSLLYLRLIPTMVVTLGITKLRPVKRGTTLQHNT
ncbi:MAG: outer membrane protein assembly factor BamB family protein, partial [Woeseiales bacterium]